MKDRRENRPFLEWIPVEVERAQGKGKWGWIWWMCFVFIFENRRVKPAEVVLRHGGGGGRRMEEVNLTKIHCKHMCKYHHVSPEQIL
jgi:hypothetical protein